MQPQDFIWTANTANLPSQHAPGGGDDGRLHIRWLGTAGYELTCEGYTLLIDPYFTRVSLPQFLFTRILPDPERIAAGIGRVDGVLVGHSHFDHAMDVPLIAKLTGAPVWGSSSTGNLLQANGIPESQIHVCHGGEVFEVGPFKVTMVPSEHSRFGLGGRVPYDGEILCSCEIPMKGSDYRVGQVFGLGIEVAGLTIYHLGSANLIDDAIPFRNIDVLLMCIAARHATERFIPRALWATEPKLVVPMHYDNFFRQSDQPLRLLPRTAFGRFVDDVSRFDRDIGIATLDLHGQACLHPI